MDSPYSINHPPEDASRDDFLEELTVYFARLRQQALENGHPISRVQMYERQMYTQCWELLSKVVDLADSSTIPVYSKEQLEYIEQHYPKLIRGDIVEFSEPVPDPRLPKLTFYRMGVVEEVTRVFPDGCAQYGLIGLMGSVDSDSEYVRPGCVELNVRDAKVIDHMDLPDFTRLLYR